MEEVEQRDRRLLLRVRGPGCGEYRVPNVEGRHAGVGSAVPCYHEVGVDGLCMKGLVLGVRRGKEA